ncbi:MAG: carboxypeptidase regulatory-like domain-containing protein, partial [Acidobacteria bacterium]|nr:carboxypeptidase regulatory-like domain-containing protein [Acidobacteriota bacterium]
MSQPVRDLPKVTPEEGKPEGVREVNRRNAEVPEMILNAGAGSGPVDPVVQNFHFPNAMPPPIMNFEGVPNVNGVLPPDTQGDVGVDYYVQWVNLSFDIFDKATGVSAIGGPVNGNSLWAGMGGSCEGFNSGDPITLYDHLAGRWFMSQFTGDNHQCIAVSQTGDPTGAWWLYDFLADAGSGFFPDYPKFGVWPDGYYYSANMFGDGSAMVGVFERDQMLVGGPAQFIWFFTPDTNALPSFSQLPADLDGANLPPADAPNPFVELVDDAWGYDPPYDQDGIVVTPFHVDWATPGNSTFGPPAMIDLTAAGYPFDSSVCPAFRGQCIDQPDTGVQLEALHQRMMYRLQYRNFGGYETLVTSHTVDADATEHAGVRWYELQDSGGGWGVHQAGTFAPDSDHRWMGDLAMDVSGNIAVGYSVSSSTTYPSIRWTGRLVGDPPDTLPQGEDTVIAGAGSQTHSAARWGDYSTMSVDPTDDCTFWYTQEYMPTTGSAPWQTRIASFKFPSCTPGATGTVEGTVINSATLLPIEGATVEVGGFATATDGAGLYSIIVPVDTYDVTASKFGFMPQTVMGIVVGEDDVIIQDFALDPVAEAYLDGWVTGDVHGWPLYAMIDISSGGMPIATVYTNPFNGYYEIGPLPAGTPYDLEVTSLIAGYVPAMRGIVLGFAGQTESFVLANDGSADWVQCVLDGGIVEDFEGDFPPPGWIVTDDSGSGNVWMRNDQWGRSNTTGGSGFSAAIDSDAAGSGAGTVTSTLMSPFVQLPAAPAKGIRFLHDFN